MWLFLDTHASRLSHFAWMEKGKEPKIIELEGRSNVLLPKLAKDKKNFQVLEGVCVVAGPGSFSAVRTGVLYANLLSRIKKVPLIGVMVEDAADLSKLAKELTDGSKTAEASKYIAPIYDAEPNITLPKHS